MQHDVMLSLSSDCFDVICSENLWEKWPPWTWLSKLFLDFLHQSTVLCSPVLRAKINHILQKKKKIRPVLAENTSECVFRDGATQIIHFYFLHGWLSERILVCGQSELRVGRALWSLIKDFYSSLATKYGDLFSV